MATDAEAKGAHVYLLTVTTRDIWSNPKVKFSDATPIGPLPAGYDPKQDKIERGTSAGKFHPMDQGPRPENCTSPCSISPTSAPISTRPWAARPSTQLYSDHNHTYMPGAEIVAGSIVSGLKAFPASPFLPLLSDKGKALQPADPKYVSPNDLPLKQDSRQRRSNPPIPST